MDIFRLTSTQEKIDFLEEYNNRAQMNVPEAYIHECDVFGVYLKGQLLGGFAFAIGSDMAWPQVIPRANKIFDKVPMKFCLEINLVWAKGELHQSYKGMFKFWFSVCRYASSYKNIEYITYAVDNQRHYLVNLYERISCGKLYSGEVPKYPGRQASVYYSSPLRMRMVKVICFKEFFIRFRRSLKKSPRNEPNIETVFVPR